MIAFIIILLYSLHAES